VCPASAPAGEAKGDCPTSGSRGFAPNASPKAALLCSALLSTPRLTSNLASSFHMCARLACKSGSRGGPMVAGEASPLHARKGGPGLRDTASLLQEPSESQSSSTATSTRPVVSAASQQRICAPTHQLSRAQSMFPARSDQALDFPGAVTLIGAV
jgi:hypothetical protein